MEYRLLNQIESPRDLKAMPEEDVEALCGEIRDFLITSVDKTGGHLASNLGVVELTVALHRCFDFSKDHLILDVGHQCYVHKLLTGRRDRFDTLRSIGGLSGFPKRTESEYDAFGTGHSSTSLSAALGFAQAEHLRGSDAYTVAVIGDGAFTGGMIHEALNNCARDRKLILILNENEMSISHNIGTFAEHIAKIRASERYYRTKKRTVNVISRLPLIGQPLFQGIRFIKQSMKNMMYGSNLFEELGLYYLGPIDGNDYHKVQVLLKEAVAYGKSAVIHVRTKKGKGYAPAEEQPSQYHSIAPQVRRGNVGGETFSSHLGETLCTLAPAHPSLCAITAAMGEATGLDRFRLACSDRYFDVGIAEEHALTFCAGLAAAGMRPVFAVYSSFLQRGYDNLIHDIALQGLPVTICIDRAGLSAGDGATHHGIFDVAFLSQIPGMTIVSPISYDCMEAALRDSLTAEHPYAIRYHNGGELSDALSRFYPASAWGMPRADFQKNEKKRFVILTYGKLLSEALKAEDKIGAECGVIVTERLAPYAQTAKAVAELLPSETEVLLIAEEGVKNGGAAMLLRDALSSSDVVCQPEVRILAIESPFASVKQVDSVYAAYGIDAEAMVNRLKEK